VVIAPRLVISAAHCANGLYASGRPQVLVPHADHDEIIDISKISVPIPAVEDGTGGWDVALFTLDRATSAPVAQLGSMSIDANLLGKIAEVHGFGITDARTGTNRVPAAGTVSIASIGDHFIRFSPAPNMICDGDSGGALFVEEEQGLALAGILSQADSACGAWGTATRLDTILRGVLSEAAAVELAPQRTATEASQFEHLCSSACTDDRDCPAGTHCTPWSAGAARCVASGLLPGELAGSCNSHQTCDACVQLQGVSADCACYKYCSELQPLSRDGCAVAGRPGRHDAKASQLLYWLSMLAMLSWRYRTSSASRATLASSRASRAR